MLKKILILFFFILLGSSSFVYFKYKTMPTSIYPYPYIVKKAKLKNSKEVADANVLILGDRLGMSLNRFIPGITSTLSKNLRTELKILNLSQNGMALHRVIATVRSLDKLPAITIIIGSGQEFLEERIRTSDKDIYEENFKIFSDEKFSSLILSFPILSRFIYKKPTKYFVLGEDVIPFKSASKSRVSQLRAEYIYKYYQLQLKELTTLMREKGSTLVFITNPVNLEVAPRLTCDNSITNSIMIEQKDIEKLLRQKRSKDALLLLTPLAKNTFGNARTHFLLGRAYLLEGNLKKSKEQFSIASALDCANWRANPIFNKLLVNHSKKNDIKVIDFSKIVDASFGKNITFKDDLFPQDLYYQKLSKEIILTIKSILQI